MRYFPSVNNTLFDELFEDMFAPVSVSAPTLARTDIYKKDDQYILNMELPGFAKEDVKITLYNGELTISAAHSSNQEEKDDKGHVIRQERHSGSITRSFYVGDGVTDADIQASMENGMLKLTVPAGRKKAAEEKKFIEIL
ncbi:MAG: Hsp20/alpha crystallin family protein [Solobacterium sp.]|nr:Hsp20/alpha crystallin family protein [Solobacterium sp.]